MVNIRHVWLTMYAAAKPVCCMYVYTYICLLSSLCACTIVLSPILPVFCTNHQCKVILYVQLSCIISAIMYVYVIWRWSEPVCGPGSGCRAPVLLQPTSLCPMLQEVKASVLVSRMQNTSIYCFTCLVPKQSSVSWPLSLMHVGWRHTHSIHYHTHTKFFFWTVGSGNVGSLADKES